MDASLTVRRSGGVVVVALSGDYDLGRAAALHTDLLDALRSRPTGIVVDLGEVSFIDLACLRTMANLGRRSVAVGTWFRLAGPSPIARRLLEITGLCASLPCYPDVELALRGARARPSIPAAARAVSAEPTAANVS